jgi:hypothetical protein
VDQRPNPNEKLVKVFESEQESEALVVKGLLESSGIDSLMASFDAEQDLFPVGGVMIRVREEQAEEARRLIAESRNDAEESGEEDISEESPSEA